MHPIHGRHVPRRKRGSFPGGRRSWEEFFDLNCKIKNEQGNSYTCDYAGNSTFPALIRTNNRSEFVPSKGASGIVGRSVACPDGKQDKDNKERFATIRSQISQ